MMDGLLRSRHMWYHAPWLGTIDLVGLQGISGCWMAPCRAPLARSQINQLASPQDRTAQERGLGVVRELNRIQNRPR